MPQAIGCLLIIVIVFAIGTCSSSSGGSAKATPAPTGAAIVALAQTAGPTATIGPTNTPQPTPTYAPSTVYVGNTGGDGVALRKAPGSNERLKAWADGAKLTVIDYEQLADGQAWRNVRDPDANVGWVMAQYLVTPTPAPLPTSTPDRSQYKMELLASSGTWRYSFATVSGQVKNISLQSLRNVTAVAQW